MAEPSFIRYPRKRQKALDRAARMINESWAGGWDAMKSAYLSDQITLRDIQRTTRLDYRALQTFFASEGVHFRDTKFAVILARKLNPAWNQNISRAKIAHAFHHAPNVTRAATAKRIATWRADPNRHGLSHAKMNEAESEFARLLDSLGIAFNFNQHSEGFWLDFYLPGTSHRD